MVLSDWSDCYQDDSFLVTGKWQLGADCLVWFGQCSSLAGEMMGKRRENFLSQQAGGILQIEKCLIDRNSLIDKNCLIDKKFLIGRKSQIGKNGLIGRHCLIGKNYLMQWLIGLNHSDGPNYQIRRIGRKWVHHL